MDQRIMDCTDTPAERLIRDLTSFVGKSVLRPLPPEVADSLIGHKSRIHDPIKRILLSRVIQEIHSYAYISSPSPEIDADCAIHEICQAYIDDDIPELDALISMENPEKAEILDCLTNWIDGYFSDDRQYVNSQNVIWDNAGMTVLWGDILNSIYKQRIFGIKPSVGDVVFDNKTINAMLGYFE